MSIPACYMTITHKDFFRLLPRALNGLEYSVSGKEVTVIDGEKQVYIRISDEGVRQLASVKFPRTEVEIELLGFNDAEAGRFIARFDLAYQKGGG